MTEENFNYRTSPLFLRNEFDSKGEWKIPIIPKCDLNINSNEDLRVIGFDKLKSNKDKHYNRLVHFFLYDYEFEKIWEQPQKYIDTLKQYKGILSPDFSMYIEMNPVMQLYNTFRNRWVGAYMASKGIKVIPTVNWGLENTFDFCFNGIEKGSTVAVSTYMVNEHGHHKAQKDFFLKGYNEMVKRIEPELVICYSEPFPEMEGNILYIDYDLSSWQHYSDDEIKEKAHTSNIITKYHYTYVIPYDSISKGTGSAFGGEWQPKKPEDERFLGEPGEIKYTFISTKKEGYWVVTKIGNNGRANLERQLTDHGRADKHSNPHDQEVIWSGPDSHPSLGPPINYFDGEIPEFKYYKHTGEYQMTEDWNGDFKTKFEFKDAISRGCDLCFEWKGTEYGIFPAENNQRLFCKLGNDCSEDIYFSTIDDVMNYKLGEDKLIDICTKISVIERNI